MTSYDTQAAQQHGAYPASQWHPHYAGQAQQYQHSEYQQWQATPTGYAAQPQYAGSYQQHTAEPNAGQEAPPLPPEEPPPGEEDTTLTPPGQEPEGAQSQAAPQQQVPDWQATAYQQQPAASAYGGTYTGQEPWAYGQQHAYQQGYQADWSQPQQHQQHPQAAAPPPWQQAQQPAYNAPAAAAPASHPYQNGYTAAGYPATSHAHQWNHHAAPQKKQRVVPSTTVAPSYTAVPPPGTAGATATRPAQNTQQVPAAAAQRKARVETELRTILTEADRLGERWTRSWDVYPLPPSARAAGAPVPSTPPGLAGFAQSSMPEDRSFAYKSLAPSTSRRSTSDSSDDELDQPAIKPGSWKAQAKQAKRQQQQHNKHLPQSPRPGSSKKQKKKWAARQQQQQQQRGSPRYSDDSSSSDASEDKPRYKALDMSGTNEAGLHARNGARAQRFGDGTVAHSGRAVATPKKRKGHVQLYDDGEDAERMDWSKTEIRGTCTELLKSYFRLHTVPHPSTVRPPAILQKALAQLLSQIRTKQVKYIFAADQLKGMRQDLTVSAEAARHPAVAHAMKVRLACSTGDATRLCALYPSAPLMNNDGSGAMAGGSVGVCEAGAGGLGSDPGGAQLLPGCTREVFAGRFAPSADPVEAMELCVEWLMSCNAVIKPPTSGEGEAVLDCKASRACITMPDDPDAVAHGDANLALDDFMKASLRPGFAQAP
ncbi:hypothetical protein WJX73_003081 [Symbiochloris irregularis]|uniref:Uncharacterized protein n=1 Tax=Symbiochloris irregularis TaxID=706552 RepID=A0AAW1PSL4_9CHLO